MTDKTVGFDNYIRRPAINKRELKNKTPNASRFEPLDLMPKVQTGYKKAVKFSMSKTTARE